MDSFWFDFAISIVITTLRAAIKDPKKAASVKGALLKVASLIQQAYGNDPAFRAALAKK